MKIAMMAISCSFLAVCSLYFSIRYSFSCLFYFSVSFFLLCVVKFTSSLYSRLFFIQVLNTTTFIAIRKTTMECLLLLRPTAQTSIQFEFNSMGSRMWAYVFMCVCASVLLLCFLFLFVLLFLSGSFIHSFFVHTLSPCCVGVCKCVCVSFQPIHWNAHAVTIYVRRTKRPRDIISPAYIPFMSISPYIDLSHTHTSPHTRICTGTHSLARKQSLYYKLTDSEFIAAKNNTKMCAMFV